MRKGQSLFKLGNTLVFTESQKEIGRAIYFYPRDVAVVKFTLYKYVDRRQ